MKYYLKKLYGFITFNFFKLFKVKNTVFFSNFSGKCYSDNTKYISEYLHKNYPDIKLIWTYRYKKFDMPEDIIQVKWGSLKMIYYLSTSKVWVDTHVKPYWMKKRKNQYYIETWHGGLGMKKIEGDAEEKLPKDLLDCIKNNSKMADLFISNSDWLSNIYKRAFWYNGSILECGYPKNDVLFSNNDILNDIKKSVFNKLNIDINTKVLLYAPTFRENGTFDAYSIDFVSLINTLKNKYGCNIKILIKLHPKIKRESSKFIKYTNEIIDVSNYNDMQELIIASDFFITDYSSGIFDFAMLKKPAFIYASDIEEYEKERGLYFDIKKLPFPFSENNQDLIHNINNFDNKKYEEELDIYFKSVGLKERGTATEVISNIIIDKLR